MAKAAGSLMTTERNADYLSQQVFCITFICCPKVLVQTKAKYKYRASHYNKNQAFPNQDSNINCDVNWESLAYGGVNSVEHFLIVQKARKVFSHDANLWQKLQALIRCHADRAASNQSLFFLSLHNTCFPDEVIYIIWGKASKAPRFKSPKTPDWSNFNFKHIIGRFEKKIWKLKNIIRNIQSHVWISLF